MATDNSAMNDQLCDEDSDPDQSSKLTMWHVVLLLALHWSLSSSITFSNNFLVGHDLPNVAVFVAASQSALSFLILAPIAFYTHRDSISNIFTPDFIFRKYEILPLCCSFVGMQAFNRLALRQVGVACLQISRSLTVIFTVVLTFILLKTALRRSTLFFCLLVIAGFTLGVNQSPDSVTMKGFIFGVISSAFTSTETTLTKRVLPYFDNSPLLQAAVLNGVSTIIFVPLLFMSGNLDTLIKHWNLFITPGFVALLLFSSCLSASFGFFTYRVIQATSPVTLVFSNSAHTSSQTVLAVCIFRQATTPLWWISNILIIVGTLGYAINKVKVREQAEHHTLPSADDSPKLKVTTL